MSIHGSCRCISYMIYIWINHEWLIGQCVSCRSWGSLNLVVAGLACYRRRRTNHGMLPCQWYHHGLSHSVFKEQWCRYSASDFFDLSFWRLRWAGTVLFLIFNYIVTYNFRLVNTFLSISEKSFLWGLTDWFEVTSFFLIWVYHIDFAIATTTLSRVGADLFDGVINEVHERTFWRGVAVCCNYFSENCKVCKVCTVSVLFLAFRLYKMHNGMRMLFWCIYLSVLLGVFP